MMVSPKKNLLFLLVPFSGWTMLIFRGVMCTSALFMEIFLSSILLEFFFGHCFVNGHAYWRAINFADWRGPDPPGWTEAARTKNSQNSHDKPCSGRRCRVSAANQRHHPKLRHLATEGCGKYRPAWMSRWKCWDQRWSDQWVVTPIYLIYQ